MPITVRWSGSIYGSGLPRPHPERMIRGFVDYDIVSSEQTVREPKAPDLVRPEAFISWGAASEFTVSTFRADAGVAGPYRKKDDKKPPRKRHNFTEEGRRTRDFRVVNPDDPEQYVISRAATQVAFSGPNGAQFTFILSPQTPGLSTGSGQTPPAPPDLSKIGE